MSYLLNESGEVIAETTTTFKSGDCTYYRNETADGTPVNSRSGKISNAKKHANKCGDSMTLNTDYRWFKIV